jgi:hypothetical protein
MCLGNGGELDQSRRDAATLIWPVDFTHQRLFAIFRAGYSQWRRNEK